MKLVELKGYDLIIGKKIDFSDNPMLKGLKDIGNTLGDDESKSTGDNIDEATQEEDDEKHTLDKKEVITTNWFMVLVLLSALAGLILSFANNIKKGLGAIVPATLALIGLLTFIIVMNYQLQSKGGMGNDGSFGITIKLGYEIGFWLMLLLLLFIIAYNIYNNYIAIKANAPDQAEPVLDEPPQNIGNG